MRSPDCWPDRIPRSCHDAPLSPGVKAIPTDVRRAFQGSIPDTANERPQQGEVIGAGNGKVKCFMASIDARDVKKARKVFLP